MTLPGSNISSVLESDSCAVSLVHLELRREREEGYTKVAESKVEVVLQDS